MSSNHIVTWLYSPTVTVFTWFHVGKVSLDSLLNMGHMCVSAGVQAGVKPGFQWNVFGQLFLHRLIYRWAACHDNNMLITSRRDRSELLTLAESAVSRSRRMSYSAKTTEGMWDALVTPECAGVCVRYMCTIEKPDMNKPLEPFPLSVNTVSPRTEGKNRLTHTEQTYSLHNSWNNM